jgi:nucleoid-associated protein YgaU
MKIAEANGLADPNKIRVGQRLKIPGTTRGPDAVLD